MERTFALTIPNRTILGGRLGGGLGASGIFGLTLLWRRH